ncbi:MAG: tRNA pseudouridine38-40 synthase [Myxococcota bacterium]|jgi:tRNA pseudouridine38-40 synthase
MTSTSFPDERPIAERRRRIVLLIQYDGTDFRGWQVQPNTRTVSSVLKASLERLFRETHCPSSTSRTDSGVHALGLPVTLKTDRDIRLIGIVRGLNTFLPDDLSIRVAADVDDDFHIRHDAIGKRYIYRIHNGRVRSAKSRRTHWLVKVPLNVEAMQRAAQGLVGEHDYSSFRAAACQASHPVRRIESITVEALADGDIEITVIGNAFLQHMVRIVVGTLVEVGRGHESESFPAEALAARARPAAGPTAPGLGLELSRVFYDPDPFCGDTAWPPGLILD